MEIQESIPLAPHTTFGLGGPARWFAVATSETEVLEALAYAGANRARLFVLGGGSNLLVSDAGFDGLVLQMALRGIRPDYRVGGPGCRYTAMAGGRGFPARTVREGYAGLECLSGIPGTVGGTPVQNVGAYGQEVATTIESVRVLDLFENFAFEMKAADCGFGYRASRFNGADSGRFIVLSVTYELMPGAPHMAYRDLAERFRGHSGAPTLQEARDAVREIRHAKGMLIVPGEADCRSAALLQESGRRWRRWPGRGGRRGAALLRRRPARSLPAAWLIERAGFMKARAALPPSPAAIRWRW
jgi:UDP-N-acetylmuramate dehydrogenase